MPEAPETTDIPILKDPQNFAAWTIPMPAQNPQTLVTAPNLLPTDYTNKVDQYIDNVQMAPTLRMAVEPANLSLIRNPMTGIGGVDDGRYLQYAGGVRIWTPLGRILTGTITGPSGHMVVEVRP